jgi:hypothetical protein
MLVSVLATSNQPYQKVEQNTRNELKTIFRYVNAFGVLWGVSPPVTIKRRTRNCHGLENLDGRVDVFGVGRDFQNDKPCQRDAMSLLDCAVLNE